MLTLPATALRQSKLEDLLYARYAGFVAFLRANGFKHAETTTALRSLEITGQLDPQVTRWTLRAGLCGRQDEWRRFDELFDHWFMPANRRRRSELRASGAGKLDKRPGTGDDSSEGQPLESGAGSDYAPDGAASSQGASAEETLERSDFRHLHEPDALRELDELMRRFIRRLLQVELRRYRPSTTGLRLDVARTIRRSVSYGGLPLKLAWTQRRTQRPRIVMLIDVSRSMNLYSYFYLRLARILAAQIEDVHCFMFHTRLTRISHALRDADPARARESLYLLSSGWAGGTQIGASLEQFNRDYGSTLVHRRTCVFIASDGFDTLPAERAGNALRTLHGQAHSVIWLNPLASQPGYTPSSACMQAALPFIDLLVPAGNLADLKKALPDILRACR